MKGTIIKSLSGKYNVFFDENIIECTPKGLFRYEKVIPRVGDTVEVEGNTITKVYKRRNAILRPNVANVDKIIIVTSIVEPNLNLNLLDRMISQAEYNDISTVLVFSKCDLVDDKYNDIIAYYKNLGYPTYITPKDYDALAEEIRGCVCVLSGQSGVGKSTLINYYTGLNIKTNSISYALGRGKHTTRHVELLRTNGGWIADTPGFGIMDLDMSEMSLSQTFREFFATKCKYKGCLHEKEPGCNVKAKVASGEFMKSRYNNYLLFLAEIRKNKKY